VQFSSFVCPVPLDFGGVIARGKHLFPFRTEPLSLSAPMVLGSRDPGRVGRRRFFSALTGHPSGWLLSLRGFEPVLAEGGEVDHEIEAVEEPLFCLDQCHGAKVGGGPDRTYVLHPFLHSVPGKA
jgi:hypothetical protein